MSSTLESDEALAALRAGGVVGVPTDTVYGLAASLDHPLAVARLFTLKRRPSTVALPVLVDGVPAVEALGVEWPLEARALSDALWPGALTIVVAVPHALAELVGATTDTAGFRVPDDDVLLDVLARSGPLAVSSANDHGEAPSRSAGDVLAYFAGREGFAGVLDGGERGDEVSTVVEIVEGTWRILRQGAVSAETLSRVLS